MWRKVQEPVPSRSVEGGPLEPLDADGNVLWENQSAPFVQYVPPYNSSVVASAAGHVHVVFSVTDGKDNNMGQFAIATYRYDGTYTGRKMFGNAGVDESVISAGAWNPDGLVVAGRMYVWDGGNGANYSILAGYRIPSDAPVPVAPVFAPPGGTFSGPVDVAMSSATPSATISYTTDGSAPTATNGTQVPSGTVLAIDRTTSLKAVAFLTGTNPVLSAVTSGQYNMVAGTPSLSPGGGTYYSAQDVTLSTSTPGAVIRYTKDALQRTGEEVRHSPQFCGCDQAQLGEGAE